MTEPGITLNRLGYDDECWLVKICGSNGLFVATLDFYTHPTELAPFAEALLAFPKDIHTEARFEQGEPTPDWAFHLLVRAFLSDGSGHSAIEFAVQDHPSTRLAPSASFFILAEATAINRFGRMLSWWIDHADGPLSWTTQNP